MLNASPKTSSLILLFNNIVILAKLTQFSENVCVFFV
jgi:hypothetical protein